MNFKDIPLGFGMALAQNPEAMQKFSLLNEDKKQQILNGTHSIRSKNEMKQYVRNIITEYN